MILLATRQRGRLLEPPRVGSVLLNLDRISMLLIDKWTGGRFSDRRYQSRGRNGEFETSMSRRGMKGRLPGSVGVLLSSTHLNLRPTDSLPSLLDLFELSSEFFHSIHADTQADTVCI